MSEGPSMQSLLKEHIHLARVLRRMEIRFDSAQCLGLWHCYEVCPVDCWAPDWERGTVVFQNKEKCIACGACVLQCPEEAIELRVPDG
ncbi:MAG: hypothetical protein GTO18_21150 [Anaerolineales bacterium]|nr:hypothetical protein [Anaerolineales bacterium]